MTVKGVHAMHDPTEGGLSAACYEMAEAAGVGLRIERAGIPLMPEGAQLCADLGLDPLGAIASGALLIAAAPSAEALLFSRLRRAGISVSRIGVVVPDRQGIRLIHHGKSSPLPRFPADELARYLSTERPSTDQDVRPPSLG